MAETRQLSLHPLAIHTFIKAQAGSLGKALSEAVMNSVDAFAHIIEVRLTSDGFFISDDGQGFRDRDEIAAWFETLGFPHDEGNHRQYGKFGMGRAQMWAFARTTWRSNQFIMKVDVKAKGLDYELDEDGTRVKGTSIEGTFYEEMPFARLTQVEMELENLVKYVPALISINGRVISKDPSTEEWTLETPEAFMRFEKSKHTLDVYNGGVLVAHFPRYRFNVTGTVITKPGFALSLNVARNEILETECTVWPKIVKSFPKPDAPDKPKKAKPSARTLDYAAREFVAKVKTLEKTLEQCPELLVSVLGRAVKLSDLYNRWNSLPVVVVPKGDDFGKRLSKLKKALTISKESLEKLGFTSVDAFKAEVRKVYEVQSASFAAAYRDSQLNRFDAQVWTDKPEELFRDLVEGRTVYAASELSLEEKQIQIAWRRNLAVLRNGMVKSGASKVPTSVSLGDCPSRLAWIDGQGELVLRKAEAMAAMNKPFAEVLRYVQATLVECFQKDICEQEPMKGLESAIKLITQSHVVGQFAISVSASHVSLLKEEGLPIPRTRLSELSQLEVE